MSRYSSTDMVLDPGTNNQPLQFNRDKGKPPMPKSEDQMRDVMGPGGGGGMGPGVGGMGPGSSMMMNSLSGLSNMLGSMGNMAGMGGAGLGGNMASSLGGMMGMDSGGMMSSAGSMGGGMGPGSMMSSSMMGPGNMMSSSMMGPGPMGGGGPGPMDGGPGPMGGGPGMGFSQFGGGGGMMGGPGGMLGGGMSMLQDFEFDGGVMYAPPPGHNPPPLREKPPGCRTVFVGGLPDNITEEMIESIFSRCGLITSIRLSKKNFAHIRFEDMAHVENAVMMSGYRVRMGDTHQDDKAYTGRVHVDYAQARDDQHEWECQQRAVERERRHRERLERERMRPPSPPRVMHYSEHEAQTVSEKLRTDTDFNKAVVVLITWLERGDCHKRTASTFYSLVQSTNSHIRRLVNERAQHDEEFMRAKEQYMFRIEGIVKQLDQIDQVFEAASKQRSWDHFTKAQRKNLEMWKKQCKDQVAQQNETFNKYRGLDEMDLSDDDGPGPEKRRRQDNGSLQTELSATQTQLDAARNEADMLRSEKNREEENKDRQVKALQQALQGMQQQLIEASGHVTRHEGTVKSLRAQVSELERAPKVAGPAGPPIPAVPPQPKPEEPKASGDSKQDVKGIAEVTQEDARMMAVISTFLHVHPFGASADYLWSYLQRLRFSCRSSDIEALLERYPAVFRQEMCGVGASIEKRWKLLVFNDCA